MKCPKRSSPLPGTTDTSAGGMGREESLQAGPEELQKSLPAQIILSACEMELSQLLGNQTLQDCVSGVFSPEEALPTPPPTRAQQEALQAGRAQPALPFEAATEPSETTHGAKSQFRRNEPKPLICTWSCSSFAPGVQQSSAFQDLPGCSPAPSTVSCLCWSKRSQLSSVLSPAFLPAEFQRAGGCCTE